MSSSSSHAAKHSQFATTQWSLVLEAAQESADSKRAALTDLCQSYWFPLYVYVRRRGYSEHDAQDLTQAFFVRLFEKQALLAADPDRGRFRSFLLGSLKNFLANEWDKETAQKRGGGVSPISFDSSTVFSPAESLTPEDEFDRQWALTLLDITIDKLAREYANSQKEELFTALKPYITVGETMKYVELATSLQMSESSVKVSVHRLRKRYGELLRTEIAQTVADQQEVDDEIRRLFEALG